jgi:hypothetical protein
MQYYERACQHLPIWNDLAKQQRASDASHPEVWLKNNPTWLKNISFG